MLFLAHQFLFVISVVRKNIEWSSFWTVALKQESPGFKFWSGVFLPVHVWAFQLRLSH